MCGIDYNRFPEWERCNWSGKEFCNICGKLVTTDNSYYDEELDDYVCTKCAEEIEDVLHGKTS